MQTLRAILAGAALALGAQVAVAGPWSLNGKVVHVDDGDTLVLLLVDKTRVKVRLSDVDAPESSHTRARPGQPYSEASKQSLVALAKGQEATATCYEHDRWERAVCTVYIHGHDINAEQLRRGMAWVNGASRRYVRNPQSYAIAAQAEAARVGLWAGQGAHRPVSPWEWRKRCWAGKSCDSADSPT